MSFAEIAGLVIMIGFVIFIFRSGYLDGSAAEEKKWKKDTIDRGLAQYNAKTGEWEWIEK